jgi:6-phospho 3-hexuloisomerase
MTLRREWKAILGQVEAALGEVSPAEIGSALEKLERARRVFVAGAGRAGLVARMFAMRLMQGGLRVHAVGEVTTPAIGRGDVLLVISGTGETATSRHYLRAAKEQGASALLITASRNSSCEAAADSVLHVPAPTRARRRAGSLSPQSLSLFEQASFLLLEAMAHELLRRRGVTAAQLLARHANLE